MSDFKLDNFIIHHLAFHNVLYTILMIIAVLTRLLKFTDNTDRVVIFCLVVLFIMLADFFLFKAHYFESMNVFYTARYLELLAFNALEPIVGVNVIVITSIIAVVFILSIEFAIYGTDYDKTTLSIRKIMLIGPVFVNAVIAYASMSQATWLCYILTHIVVYVAIFFIISWMSLQNDTCSMEINKLKLKLSHVESDNEKLLEYQERVKAINEQINYQKIDLAKAIRNLEQNNKEIKSQTDLMKYMASTTDILKCLNVMSDAIVEIKKAKICAIYIDKDVYMNSQPSIVIKSNYTSMEQRLKKEISRIYSDMLSRQSNPVIITGTALEQYKFIGDANMKTFAALPIVGADRIVGLMMVGSDKVDFFDSGLNYYESCIAELNITLKSTLLYLKTQDMARKDGLTGIYNRLYFNELIANASKKAEENNEFLSVALFDIDKFKNVNDTYGHLTGDEVIKSVAATAEKYAIKYNGFCCRYGGEEFLLVLPGYNERDMLSVLEEMHSEIRAVKIPFNDTVFSINVCIGFTTYPSICSNTELLVSRADKAMYYGKEHGRGRLVMDNPDIDKN